MMLNAQQMSMEPSLFQFEQDFEQYGWIMEPQQQWKEFYEYWSRKDYEEECSKPTVTLAYRNEGVDDAKYRLKSAPATMRRFFVRDSYRGLVKRIREFARVFPDKGIVVTGQPGTGKTTWLWFMLICCIMNDEAVLFHFKGKTRFFLNGQVYQQERTLPTFPDVESEDCRIWSLIDSDHVAAPPPPFLSEDPLVFPVQASSPNEVRYKAWAKDRQGYIWGMPLWTQEELMQGLNIHKNYIPFMEQLHHELRNAKDKEESAPDEMSVDGRPPANEEPPSIGSIDTPAKSTPPSPDRGFRKALDKAMKFAQKEDGLWNDAETIFAAVLKDAIHEYGEVPRDICEAVFVGYESLRKKVAGALSTGKSNLNQLMDALVQIGKAESTSGKDPPSHQLFAIEPLESSPTDYEDDTFIPEFKSEPIGQEVMQHIGRLEIVQANKFVHMFRLFPASSTLAGWIFEGIAHDVLSSGNILEDLIPMYSVDVTKDAHVHRTGLSQTSTHPLQFPYRSRKYTVIAFPKGELYWKGHGGIESNFCVPQNVNNPLFDSFCVDIDVTADSANATIWIFQATLSTSHDGSSAGYVQIRSIREFVKQRAKLLISLRRMAQGKNRGTLLRKKITQQRVSVRVEMKYVMVCPKPVVDRTWNIPKSGWTSRTKGDVFCLHIDVGDQS